MQGDERRTWWQSIRGCAGSSPADTRNQIRLTASILVWALTFVAAAWLIRDRGVEPPLVWLVVAVPAMTAFFALMNYLRFLREADELVRRIQFEALGFGFGAGVISLLVYRLLEFVGAPPQDIEVGIVPLMVGWGIGMLISTWRYR